MCDDVKGLAEREMMEAKESKPLPQEPGLELSGNAPRFPYVTDQYRKRRDGSYLQGWVVRIPKEDLDTDADRFAVLLGAKRFVGSKYVHGGQIVLFPNGCAVTKDGPKAHSWLSNVIQGLENDEKFRTVPAEFWAQCAGYPWRERKSEYSDTGDAFPGCVPCADCDAPTPWEDGGFCEDCREANEEEDAAAAEIGTTIRLKAGHEDAAISQLEEAISVLRQLASAREKMRRLVGPIAREATTMRMGPARDGELTVNLSIDGDRVQTALLARKAELFEILREIHKHEAATVGAIASMISELAEED